MNHLVGLSGGKDSTAMALRLREVMPDIAFQYLITPTGDELPEMVEHWAALEKMLGMSLIRVTNHDLAFWINYWGALPNHRQRWCARQLKIEPTIAYIKAHQPAILYVGLRADEEERKGIYSEDVQCRFPLREWGWGVKEVWGYLESRGVRIPARTDCARCYAQRLPEWRNLYRNHPEIYASAEQDEERTGKTFRSPNRDTWPAPLVQLRREFEKGRKMRGDDKDAAGTSCRVCSL